MNFKPYFFLSLIVAVFASLVGVGYTSSYYIFLFDFSSFLPIWKIIAAYFSISLTISGLRFLFDFLFKSWGELLFNIKLSILTIASILHPILVNGDFEMAEMYPGFAIPLYFFPTVTWLALAPFLNKINNK